MTIDSDPLAPEEEAAGAPGTWRPFTFADLDRLREGDVDEPDDTAEPEDPEADYQSWRERVDESQLIDTARRPQGVQVAMSGAMGLPSVMPVPSPRRSREIAGAAAGAAGAAVSDVARGAVEGPRQIVGGASDALRNFALGLDSLATWLNDHVADLRLPSTGVDALDNPLRAIAGDGPQVSPPTTTTGSILRESVRFLSAFIPASRAMSAMGVTGGMANSTAAGALADFATTPGSAPNLANLVRELPILGELATNPEDPELLNRARTALVGAGVGVLTEGVLRGIRVMAHGRAAGQAQAAEQAAQQRIEADAAAMNARVRQTLGDPDAPLLTVRRRPPDQAVQRAAAAEAATAEGGITAPIMAGRAEMALDSGMPARATVGDPEVMVNFARINTPDDVRSVIGQMVEHYAPDIDLARRGIRSNEATQEAADALGMTVPQLLRRRSGQPLNAEEALAARRLLSESGTRLAEAARAAAAPTASPADQYAFRRLMATHYAIQSEVIGARTETARALQSWAIPAGAGGDAARAIETLVTQSGGYDVSRDLAMRIADLSARGLPDGAINATIRRGWAARTRDAVMESYVLGLLWNPSTHIANTTGNTLVALQQVYERATAAGIGTLMGSEAGERVAPGEGAAYLYGMSSSIRDAFRLASEALRTGQSAHLPGTFDRPRTPAITAAAFNLDEAGGLGRFVDYVGRVTRIPGHLLAGADAFFSTLNFRGEIHAQALRQAWSEGLRDDAMVRRVAELVANPSEAIRLRAADAALYATFQNEPGRIAQTLMRLRNARGADDSAVSQLNPMFLVMPYVRTPSNIMAYTFERTPLAPLVAHWRADVAAGGARRDLALARVATGSAILLAGLDAANNGLITGGGPERGAGREVQARQGWQPYSVRIGDTYISYNRLDPLGMMLATAANLHEAFTRGDVQPEDVDEWNEVLAAGITAISRSVVDRSYFRGTADLFALIHDPRQQTRGYVNNMVASSMPLTSLFGGVERAMDPAMRETNNPLDAIQARIPVLSERLIPRRNLWGQALGTDEVFGDRDEAQRNGGALMRVYNWASPLRASRTIESPIDAELQRLNYAPERIRPQTSMAGVTVNMREYPRAYDAYVRRAGNELALPEFGGLGLRDYLNAVVSGEGGNETTQRDHRRFQSMTEGRQGQRANFISSAITRARQAAARSVIEDPQFSDFRVYWESQRGRRAEQRPDITPRWMPAAEGEQPAPTPQRRQRRASQGERP